MTRRLLLCLCLCLPACSDWPDASVAPPLSDSGAWPSLVPASELFATLPPARAGEADTLAGRAAALRARATILRRDASTNAAMEALRARLAR